MNWWDALPLWMQPQTSTTAPIPPRGMPPGMGPLKYGPQDKWGVAGVQNAIFGEPHLYEQPNTFRPGSTPGEMTVAPKPPVPPIPRAPMPAPAMPSIYQQSAPPPAPPQPPSATTSAPPAGPDWWDKHGGDLSSMLLQTGAGMLAAPPGASLGQGIGQGLGQGFQYLAQSPDRKLDRRYKQAQIGEVETKAEQRKATIAFADTIKDPMARSLMKLGLTEKAISRLEKIDPAEQQRVIDFEVAKQQALLPGNMAIRAAGKTTVNVNTTEETAFGKKIGGELAERFVKIQDAGLQATNKIATLDALKQNLESAGRTGWGAETVLGIKRAAQSIGVDVGNLGPAEASRAIGNQLALQLRNPSAGAGMPGAMSDKDREFLVASIPGLQRTPQGNAQLIDYMIRIERRNVEVAQLASQYMKNNNNRLDAGFYSQLAQWSASNPLFPEGTRGTQAAPQSQPGQPAQGQRKKWLGPGKWQ